MKNIRKGRFQAGAMPSKPMTLHEVAALLPVRESTAQAHIKDDQLRAFKFRRDWRVAVRDLESFVEAHANRAP